MGIGRVGLGLLAAAIALPAVGAWGARPAAGGGGVSPGQTVRAVGRVAGSDAFIAVVSDGASVTAYVCDGKPAGVSLWGWFAGEIDDGRAELVSTNGHVLSLDFSGETATGTLVTRTGERLSFATETAEGPAGLWRAQGTVNGEAVLAGWVVLNDGEQRGAAMMDGSVRIAPTLGITDGTSNTITFTGGALEARLVGKVSMQDFN